MFQNSMPPVLGFGTGERIAYSQTWEEEMSKKLILRCLLEEQDMSGVIKRENVEGDKEARHTLTWQKGKDKGCVSCL
jgi:hypothetical protein